eukprot:TRINITY_DN17404_c0_g1_i1.p1 TRINITY_DN17404_c0_g1~~TRINITY_DN17404_c0_g1_i1.p1  ORF type:complete len:384 (-),score=74.13 TRINITY_DN17404_c0_g1_i1:122-1273(-)
MLHRIVGIVAVVAACVYSLPMGMPSTTKFRTHLALERFDSRTTFNTSAVSLLTEFINIPSITGSEGDFASAVEAWFLARNWRVSRQNVGPNRDNLLITRGSTTNPTLLFSTHLDTVPPFIPASVDGDSIKGRGACDAKGSMVAQMLAVDDLVRRNLIGDRDVGFLFVVGEEVDGSGMKKANELNLNPVYFVNGEPTESRMAEGHKGSVAIIVNTTGVAGHSGYPEVGVSAISPMLDILQDLENEPWPVDPTFGPTTLNVGKIVAGVAGNVIPDFATANIMIRVTTTAEEILNRVKQIVGSRGEVFVSTTSDPVKCSVLPGYPSAVMSYGTDIPYFRFTGERYLYGPGSILVAHSEKEFVSTSELLNDIENYKNIALTLLARKD